jgi:hypothetical protein
MAVDKRTEMRNALLAETKHNYEHKDDSGQFRNIFKESPDLRLWKCKSGDHIFDIIPYQAGQYDPKAKPGSWKYVLILFVHYQVGVNQDAYVCPARNFNKPCPICEYRAELMKQEDYDEDLVKSLSPKQRSIYNIVVYDSEKERDVGVQVFDVAHWFMERYLAAMSKVPTLPGQQVNKPYVPFSDPDEGKLISFTRKGEGKNSEFIGHRFIDRTYTIPDEYLAGAYKLDEWITLSTYDEIKLAFYGGEEEVHEEFVPEEVTELAPPPAPPLRARTATPFQPVEEVPNDGNPCPAGGVYGTQCEELEACNGCIVWQECSEEHDKIVVEQVQQTTPEPTPITKRPPLPSPTPTPKPVAKAPLPTPIKKAVTPPGPLPVAKKPLPIKK